MDSFNDGFNTHVKSPRVGNWWDDTYGFSAGFIQSSFGDASPNSTVCMSNVTRIIENSIGFIEELRNASDAALNASAESFENILGSLYPITYACYHSAFEYGEIAIIFGETLIDGLQLLYNMIHKLGNIYDCIYFLVKHHKNHPFKKDDEEEEGEETTSEDDLSEAEAAAAN